MRRELRKLPKKIPKIERKMSYNTAAISIQSAFCNPVIFRISSWAQKNSSESPFKGFFCISTKKVPKKIPIQRSTHRTRFMSRNKPYSEPIIVKPATGVWFVKYRYAIPGALGTRKEFRVKDGINRIADLQEREREIAILRDDISRALAEGYSPFRELEAVRRQVQFQLSVMEQQKERSKLQPFTLPEAIQAYMQYIVKKGLSERTIGTYRTYINNFEAWIEEAGLQQQPAHEYTETQFAEFLDSYADEEQWSARTYNNHVNFFAGFFARVEKIERKTDKSIRYDIDLEDLCKIDRATKNKYYTDRLAIAVKKRLDGPLRDFCAFLYYSCMRPRELRMLQIMDIDISARQITVNRGKTGQRKVPICNELLDLMLSMRLDKLPVNLYVFGKNGSPAEKAAYRDYFSERYAAIKKLLKLGKEFTMYGWKHTRVINLIKAGFADRDIMQLTGHKDVKSFEAYKRDLIVDPANTMTGSTPNF